MAKTLNEQKHADQKMRFLSHARRLFASWGVKETSMSRIAGACKVTKATLYHYFTGKECILKEILNCKARESDTFLSKLSSAKTLEECLYHMGKNHLAEMEKPENLDILKILLSETMKNKDMKRFYVHFTQERIMKGAKDLISPFVKGRKSEKEVRLIFFQFLASLMHYTWNQRMVGDLSELIGNEETFVRQLAQTYAKALTS